MPAEITLPVYVRVGDVPEAHVGEVTVPVQGDQITVRTVRQQVAAFLRAAADAIEKPGEVTEEVDGAAP
ncbi:hypothetical protein [Staphylococcus warneri]|uniref:hypothetical protein n=1 Tax=Staphylococcus warneri TaxID=1292 RepID=UPI003D037F42